MTELPAWGMTVRCILNAAHLGTHGHPMVNQSIFDMPIAMCRM